MRLLIAHHLNDGHTNHYVAGKLVTPTDFRTKFRELSDRLAPALPQSTGFGYRVVWETKP